MLRDRAGWGEGWVGVGCIIVRGMLITLYHAPRQGGVGWGVGWGGVYYRSWDVDHVVSCSATGRGGVGGGVGCIIVRGMLIMLLMLRCRAPLLELLGLRQVIVGSCSMVSV